MTAYRARSDSDCIIFTCFCAAGFQAFSITFAVFEFQRIICALFNADGVEFSVIKQHGKPGIRRQVCMMSTG